MSIDIGFAESSDFEPYVGKVFTILLDDREVPVTLDNVKVLRGSDVRDTVVKIDGVELPPRQAFALTFEGPLEPQLGQGIYTFRLPKLGETEQELALFLSPFRRDAACMLYESVFN